jgi:arylsulfatase
MQPIEGVSLLPILSGQPATERPIFWEHEGNRAVRLGHWKLVARHNRPWQLFDMVADRTELHDLAGQKPQLVNALESTYQQWAQRAQVKPWPLNR